MQMVRTRLGIFARQDFLSNVISSGIFSQAFLLSPSERSSRSSPSPLSIHKLAFTHVVRPAASMAEAYKEQCYICKGAHAKYITAHGFRISSQYLDPLLVTAFISRQSRDHRLAIANGR